MAGNALLDFLKGANAAAAQTVSGPVDLLTMLLNKAGAGIKEPVGGSDWMKRRGLMEEPTTNAGYVGNALAGVLPMVAAAKAPQIANALNQAQTNALAPRTMNPQAGAIVYHGSPHKFDKFDSSKIGTGEGAQAYGHGLYFAEEPSVAQGYQQATSKDRFITNGGYFDPSQLEHLNVRAATRNGDLEEAITTARKYAEPDPDYPEIAAKAARDLAKLEQLKASGGMQKNTGSLYKVDLPDEAIARMLDWDKPLSQQALEVLDALSKSDVRYGPLNKRARITDTAVNGPVSGGSVYNDLARALVPDGERDIWRGSTPISGQGSRVAEHLRQLGIPGIRYLDGGSRGAGGGTSNFVVFPGEENALTILERNGRPLK